METSQEESNERKESVVHDSPVTEIQGAGKPGIRGAKSQIQIDIESGMSYADAEAKHSVPAGTIRQRAKRGNWLTPRTIARVTRAVTKQMVATVAGAIASEEIEAHKRRVFDIGSESVRKFKAKTPKTFKDLKIADDITRRSAGIDDSDSTNVGLLLLNEAIENHEPIEALQPDHTDALTSEAALSGSTEAVQEAELVQ